jgi:hypothetical protein
MDLGKKEMATTAFPGKFMDAVIHKKFRQGRKRRIIMITRLCVILRYSTPCILILSNTSLIITTYQPQH